tara:strand:+ start:313 stop:510 length:198 start_codon:yes stop_codon:yes gene_type:complete
MQHLISAEGIQMIERDVPMNLVVERIRAIKAMLILAIKTLEAKWIDGFSHIISGISKVSILGLPL